MTTTYNSNKGEMLINIVDTCNAFISGGLFRGANAGISEMSAGSFYSTDDAIAMSYAAMENNPTLYCFSKSGLKLIDIENTESCNEDAGVLDITDGELSDYDGYIVNGGVQVCLFGRFCCSTGKFTKLPIDQIRQDANAAYRQYGR
jgi:hypothetical protein